ncbi:MAG: hypothetical protein QOE27_2872 [Solirubrobacteraceae bacterium]|jgi:hypothetical protein|nr:hypothetical protein [Solirubrobacteraceae bacterium]
MPLPIRRPALAGLLVLAVGLAGCGGSSPKAGTAAATTTPGAAGGGARFAAVRQCLAKNGINLPERPAGARRGPGAGGGGGGGGGIFGGGGAGGAGPQLPAGVTQAQFQAALAKCGGGNLRRGGAARVVTPATRTALTKFATCMRQNGIALPAPNTTGRGPVFNTGKLNTTSPQFTAARTKCMSLLPAGFGRRPGPPPASGGASSGGA